MSVIELNETSVHHDCGDHDRFSHVVAPAHLVTEAYITGEPVRAICGKFWVPSRNPEKYPICQTCKDIMKELGVNV